jgi:hypothetical protein
VEARQSHEGLVWRVQRNFDPGQVHPKTEKPTEISWYLNGKLTESVPVTCSLEVAKQIAVKVVDHQIETDAQWAHSEYRHNSDIWKKP